MCSNTVVYAYTVQCTVYIELSYNKETTINWRKKFKKKIEDQTRRQIRRLLQLDTRTSLIVLYKYVEMRKSICPLSTHSENSTNLMCITHLLEQF